MKLSNNQLKILLLGSNLIPWDKLEVAAREADLKNLSLLEYLPSTNLVTPDQLGKIVAEELKISFANLREEKLDEKLLNLIPERVARARGVIIFEKNDNFAKVGMTDPDDIEIMHLVQKKIGKKIIPYYITKHDLEYALGKYKGSAQEKFKKILQKLKNKSISATQKDELTVEIVDVILEYGYQSKASDIHIEPFINEVMIRFRVDGILHDVLNVPKQLLELVVSRIKIMAKMRTDEHRAAQDGKISFKTALEDLDVRVSILPTAAGEKVVMRLLSSKNRNYGLEDLGFFDDNLKLINQTIKNPHGMILVTGPTGSGKTTTVYGILKILNKREINISSIEDPVEYNVEGVNQIQVNNKTNLTFANGLRAILRQDPDIIMIGEIRDEETANIAVNSALTGHLVLSTLHTNDAATTLPRFLEMGIEPFLVASTVNVAIAQRLVRRICRKCIMSYQISEDELRIIERSKAIQNILKSEGCTDFKKLRFYKGLGCPVCGNTGFAGRIGVFEILEMTERIRGLVIDRVNSDEILKAAKEEGMTVMLHDGIRKIFNGETTLMEVVRVTMD